MKSSAFHVRRITVSALFLSMALVLRTILSIEIPIFGENGMRIGLAGVFWVMPSILFGPVYGAITFGLADLLGFILKPTGPYLPLMTLVMTCGGFISGLLWRFLRDKGSRKTRWGVAIFSAAMLVLGICNQIFLSADGVDRSFYDRVPAESVNTDGMHAISRMLITRTASAKDPSGSLGTYLIFMTTGLLGCALLGLALLVADLLISKHFLKGRESNLMPILITMLLSGLAITTLNTVILRETVYASWKLLPFSVIWIPRVIEEIFVNTVKAYFVSLLLGVLSRQRGMKEIMR